MNLFQNKNIVILKISDFPNLSWHFVHNMGIYEQNNDRFLTKTTPHPDFFNLFLLIWKELIICDSP